MDIVAITAPIQAEKQDDRTIRERRQQDRPNRKGGFPAEQPAAHRFFALGHPVAERADHKALRHAFLNFEQGFGLADGNDGLRQRGV